MGDINKYILCYNIRIFMSNLGLTEIITNKKTRSNKKGQVIECIFIIPPVPVGPGTSPDDIRSLSKKRKKWTRERKEDNFFLNLPAFRWKNIPRNFL